MNAYLFPGQGAQFPGMAHDLYENHSKANEMFEMANEIVGFRISDIMFSGTEEDLRQTKVTQPAIFLHSVVLASLLPDFAPDMVAGHSLGEFSALVAAGALKFEDGLRLVFARAQAMQKACELQPSTMAAILGLEDAIVEQVCASIDGIVVPANYNCPGQLVISGEVAAVEAACVKMQEAGALKTVMLSVGGAFHSPLMQSAQEELSKAIKEAEIMKPRCPIYQNVVATAVTDVDQIRQNLIDQLTGPVRWTQTVKQMLTDGALSFTEVGPGKVLQGLVKKVDRKIPTQSAAL
jgi:[acyl-carrier-protein] S-malonyltransferase